MITIKIAFDIQRLATSIVAEQDFPYRWAGVLVDERPLPPWWNLRKAWYNRRYRRLISGMLSAELAYDKKKFDRMLKRKLVEAGVAFA